MRDSSHSVLCFAFQLLPDQVSISDKVADGRCSMFALSYPATFQAFRAAEGTAAAHLRIHLS